MGRPSKLSNPDITSKIDKIAIENPSWGTRKIAKELLEKYDIKLSHTKVHQYLSGKDNKNKAKGKLTKIVANNVAINKSEEIPELNVKYVSESEFMNIQQVFNSNEKFLYDVLANPKVDLVDKLRAAAIRYQNASKYSNVTGKGLSSKEIEKYQNLIDEQEQESMAQVNRILEAVKKSVPEEYFEKIAEVL
jgi:hypothetical protein